MELCEETHEPIVYNGRACPLCGAIEDRASVESAYDDAQEEIKNLREEIDNHKCPESPAPVDNPK